MKYLCVLPGRYHPFHKGHKASYDYVSRVFGADNVYVATSASQAPVTSPFTFDDKVKMMTALGIPSSHIVQTKSPYQAKELTDQVTDPENTAVVYAISEKDMEGDSARFKFGTKKDGSPSYLQPLPENLKKCKPMTEHAYVMTVPTVTFKVLGHDANSATQLRKLYIESDEHTRERIITDLYGRYDPALKDIFDARLDVTEKADSLVNAAKDRDQVQKMSESQKQRLYKNLRTIMLAECRVLPESQIIYLPRNPGYRQEK